MGDIGFAHCRVPTCSAVAPPEHTPCCSAHEDNLCCRHYRRFHFVEVRPCCATDARNQEAAS